MVGSRRRTDRASVERLVASLGQFDTVVSGGCRGVDTWAREAAMARRMNYVEHLPRLAPGMPRDEVVEAYYARNRLIAEDCDVLHAFVAPDRTGGTENAIKHAKAAGVKVIVMVETSEVDEVDETDTVGTVGVASTEKIGPRVYNKRGKFPKDAVYVGRPSKWGNPFSHTPGTLAERTVHSRGDAVRMYGEWLHKNHLLMAQAQQELAGKDLVCWCAPLSCHADILLQVANEVEVDET